MDNEKNPAIVRRQHEGKFLQEWTGALDSGRRHGFGSDETHALVRCFLSAFATAVCQSGEAGLTGNVWDGVRALLSDLPRDRAVAGFSATETATFVFSLKQPLFVALREALADFWTTDARRAGLAQGRGSPEGP